MQLTRAANGGQMALRLNPVELGQVHIQITRATDGSAAVHVTAERPETLQLLVSDQAQLHRALDNAGLPQEGRSLTLSLGSADTGGTGGFSPGTGNSGGGTPNDERPGGRQGSSSGSGPSDPPGAWGSGTDPATTSGANSGAATILLRGVDITA